MSFLNALRSASIDSGLGVQGNEHDRNPHRDFLGRCANPLCRSGWIHLFRRRNRPVFEGGWTCSKECTEACVQFAVQRELGSRGTALKGRHHRIPIGLLMLEKGWIAHKDLAAALKLQRESGMGRLGEWLIKLGRSDEATITRALGLQWSCPVLSVDTRCPAAPLSSIMPRLFLDAFGALPIRFHAGRIAYLGFERSLDPVLAFAVERMMGLRVECGVVQTSQFMMAQAQLLRATFPRLQLAEAASGSAAAHLIARTLGRSQPAASRLVRVHDFLWLRMSLSSESFLLAPDHNVQDLVCTIGAF